MYYFSTIIGSIILRRRKKKVVFWGHGFIRSQMILKERLRKRFFRLADLHLVYNNRSKQLMEQNGLSTHRIGNSLAYFDEVCDLPIARRSDKLNIIGFIGRLTKVKELDKLIYVAKRLMNKGCPLSIEIIGSGEVELDLFNLAEQEGVPIKFHGSLYEKGEIAKIIRYWSCTVSPGNVGLTAIDSLSVGVPVITHGNLDAQMPEFEAVKHRLTGSFYDRNNWLESLTNEVSYWIYNYEENVPFLCRKEVLDNWIIENQISEIKNALQNKVLS
jgi:glycosyltransferase involved in cell wall biosynthesis